IVDSFRQSVQLAQKDVPLAESIADGISLANAPPSTDGHPSGSAIRTRTQVVADLALYLVVLAVLVLVIWIAKLQATNAIAIWTGSAGSVLPVLTAVALFGGIGALSFVCRSALSSLKYSTIAHNVIPNVYGRRLGGYALILALVVAA